jgi:hypothetical protein
MVRVNMTIVRVLLGASLVAVLFFTQVNVVQAATLEIQYTGLDISYDGSTITDLGDPDPLESVDFLVGGTKVLGLNAPGDSPLDMDLTVPGVTNLPVGGGMVTSAAGGTLSLDLPGGDYVDLELGVAEVTYVSVSIVQLNFVLAAGAGDVLGQLLPDEVDGVFGDIVAVSFSTNIDNGTLTDNGDFITGFEANGTGEIEGALVPEPGCITLLLCGLVGLICWRRRM